MTLRFYMTEQSPMLFMEWRKDPASEGTVERAELAFSVYPSYSVPNGGKRDERYQREIQTPARTIPSPKNTAWVKLAPADASFIMYDRTFEPSNTPKAQGPCFLAADWKGILSGRVWSGKFTSWIFASRSTRSGLLAVRTVGKQKAGEQSGVHGL